VLGIPAKFIDELKGILSGWANSGYAPIKELRVVAGKCAWLGGVLPRSRCTTRVFYAVLSSQAALKALAILVALRRGVEQLKGMSVVVTVQSDSVTALALTQKLAAKSSSPGLNFLGAELAICLEELGVEEIKAVHVPGKANIEVDFLSRPSTWKTTAIPKALEGVDVCGLGWWPEKCRERKLRDDVLCMTRSSQPHLRSFVSPPTHFHSGSEVRGEKWGNSKQAYQCKAWHYPMVFGIKAGPQAFAVTFSSAPLKRAVCGLGWWPEK
jgi:hypothetical protein